MAKKKNITDLQYTDNRLEQLRRTGAAMRPYAGQHARWAEQIFESQKIAQQTYDDYVSQMRKEVEQPERGTIYEPSSSGPWLGNGSAGMIAVLNNNAQPLATAVGLALGNAKNRPGGLEANIIDNINSYMSRLASVDAQDALGSNQRLAALDEDDPNSLVNKWLLWNRDAEQIEILEGQKDNLNRAIAQRYSDELYQNLLNVENRLTELRREHDVLTPDAKRFENLGKSSYDKYKFDTVMQALGSENYGEQRTGWNSFTDNPITRFITGQGETLPIRDVTRDAYRYLWNIDNENASYSYKEGAVRNAIEAAKRVRENNNKIAQHNQEEENLYEQRVSNYFKSRRDTPGMDFFDPDTYLYKLSGVMGSSAGSWRSSAASMGLSIAATATAVPTMGGSIAVAAPIVYNINKGQGYSENNAEVTNAARELFTQKIGGVDSQKYKKIIDAAKEQLYGIRQNQITKTGERPVVDQNAEPYLTNEQLIDQYLAGNIRVNDKDIQNAKIDALSNINSLFEHDMMATTGDAAINTVLQLMPVGKLSGFSRLRPIKYARVNAKLASRNLRNNSELARRISQRASQFTRYGGSLGLGGYGAGAILGATEGALETGVRRVSTALGGTELGTLGKATFDKVNRARKFLGRAITPKRLREVVKDLKKSPKGLTTSKYLKDYSGRFLQSRISEGIEEGKQHQYAEDFKNGTLDQDPTFWSTLIDDLVSGFDMAYDIARIPLDGHFGITIKDQDRLAEIKGGMLATRPTNIVNIIQDVSPYVQEMRADDVLMHNMIADKTEALDLFAKNQAYLKSGLFAPGYKAFNDAFDTINKYNQQHKDATGEWGIAPELIEDERNRMRSVLSLANDPTTKAEAQAMGIEPDRGDQDYLDYVALKAETWRKHDREINDYNDVVDDVNKTVDKIKQDYVDSARRDHAEVTTDDESDVRKDQTTAGRNERNEQLIKDKVNYSDILARMQALLNMKKQLDAAILRAKYHGEVSNGLDKYYKRINEELDSLQITATMAAREYTSVDYDGLGKVDLHQGQVVKTQDDLSKLIVDRTLHDQLTEQYERLYKQKQNVFNVSDTLEYVTGKKDKQGNIVKAGHSKEVIKRINRTKKADDDFYNELAYHIADEEEQRKYEEAAARRYSEQQNEENGWDTADFNESQPDEYTVDTDGNPIQIELDSAGQPVDPLPEGYYVDEDGFLIKPGEQSTFGYGTMPIFGDWDDNGKAAAEEDFQSAVDGVRVHVNKSGDVSRTLNETLETIRKQQEVAHKTPQAFNVEDQYQEWGDETTGPNPNAAPIDELLSRRSQQRAQAQYNAEEKDKALVGQPTNLIWNDKRVLKLITKGPHNGQYYVLEPVRDDSGQTVWVRNFDINPDELQEVEPTSDFVIISGSNVETTQRPTKQSNRVYLPAVIYNPQFGITSAVGPQQETLDRLRQKSVHDKEIVIKQSDKSNMSGKYDTTSRSYFIRQDDGRVLRYRRVHAVLLEQYVHDDVNRRVRQYNSKLSTFVNVRDIISYIDDWIKNISTNSVSEDLWNGQIHDLEVYKTYLKDNEGSFNADINSQEVKDTLDDIANIMGQGTFGISVVVGNIVDEITRFFFSSKAVNDNFVNNREQAVRELGEMAPSFDPTRPYRSWFNSLAVLNQFVDQLIAIKSNFDKLGWVISSEPYTWHTEFKNVGKVAGETDLIAVDKAGNIHVIDIKTAYTGFRDKNTLNLSATQEAQQILTKEDVELNTQKARKLKKDLSKKYGQRLILSVNDDGDVEVLNRINPFYDITNAPFGQVRSKYQYYTDQQNWYAMMITSEFSNDVKSIELLPFEVHYRGKNGIGVDYIQSVENFKDGEKPMRLMLLSRNAGWNNQTVIPQNEIDYAQKVDHMFNQADGLSQRLQMLSEDLQGILESITDIPEAVANYLQKIQENVYNYHGFIEADDFSPYDNIDAFDNLQAIINGFNNLINQYDSIRSQVDAQYSYEAQMAAYAAEYDAYQRWLDDHTADSLNEPPAPPKQPQKPTQPSSGEGDAYVPSKTHFGAHGRTLLYYKHVQADPELTQATTAPDFITNAKIYVGDKNGSLYCDIEYHGKIYKNIWITTKDNRVESEAGKKLWDQYNRLRQSLQPGQKIIADPATMTRTKGRIVVHYENGKVVRRSIAATDLIGTGQNAIYDVEMSTQYGLAGYVDKGQAVTWGESDSQNVPLNVQMRPGIDATESGTFIWLKPSRHDENNSIEYIPITVQKKQLSKQDIDFIIDIIANPEKRNSKLIAEDGSETNITYKSLLNLLFPIAESNQEVLQGGGNITKLQFLGANNSTEGATYSTRVALRNSTDVATNQLDPVNIFDVADETDRKRLADRLSKLTIPEQHNVMMSRLGVSEDNTLPFKAVREYFINRLKSGKSTSPLVIKINGQSTSLQFDASDFSTVKGESGATRYGLSGLGWYVKHGIFETEYDHIGSANVEINDLTILDSNKSVDSNGMGIDETPAIPTAPEVIDDGYVDASIDDIDDDWGAPKVIGLGTRQLIHQHLDEKTARRRLAYIFGEDFANNKETVSVQKEILGVVKGVLFNQNGALVGNCYADAIALSEEAPDGVEFHEAFHRILELLTSKDEHDKIYRIIAKKEGITYSNDVATQRKLGEYAADGFMEFAKGYWTPNNRIAKLFANIYNRIRTWLNMFIHRSERDIYRMYGRAITGYYKDAKPSEEMLDRFERVYKDGAHYEIHGEQFEHIVNGAMYDKLKESVLYTICKGTDVDPTGRNIAQLGQAITKETFRNGADRLLNAPNPFDMFGEKTDNPTIGQVAMKELYDHFDNDGIRQDIANVLQLIGTDYTTTIDDEDREDLDGGDPSTADPSDHTRLTFEFSPFTRTTSRVRFFFATIPEQVWSEKEIRYTGKDGKPHKKTVRVPVTQLNDLGLPQFTPMAYLFNDVLSLLHDCDTDDEILHAVNLASKNNPTYKIVYKRLKQIHNSIYDEYGRLKDADAEALWVQLRTQIENHKYNFEIAKASRTGDPDNPFGQFTIQMQNTDTDYNAKHYPLQWSSMLANGGTPLIKIDSTGRRVINPANQKYATQFKAIHDMFDSSVADGKSENGLTKRIDGLKQWIQNAETTGSKVISQFPIKVIDKEKSTPEKTVYKRVYLTDPKNDAQFQLAKDRIVSALNMLGINMNSAELEYMLIHKYGSSDYTAVSKMLNSKAINDSMTSFLSFLQTAVKQDGTLNTRNDGKINVNGSWTNLDQVYTKFAFVKELANWKYQYRHAHDQLMVLATNNNKYYLIAQNNYLTDVARDFNKRGEEYQRLTSGQDPYTYSEDDPIVDEFGQPIGIPDYKGSYVLHELRKDDQLGKDKRRIGFINLAGFKTDERGDYGQDYYQMQIVEDVIAKIAFLQNGDIISPTRSDKKSWSVLRGIRLPGYDYRRSVDNQGNIVANPTYGAVDVKLLLQDTATPKTILQQHEDVLDVFLRYALSEYDSVKAADRMLDKLANEHIDKETLVENYYKNEQGAKFAQLLGVYVPLQDADGNVVGEKYMSFNNNKKSRKDNIKTAEDYFFTPKIHDEKGNIIGDMQFDTPQDLERYQKSLIARNLMAVCDKELENLVQLGLIARVANESVDYFNYKNIGLDSTAIESIYKSIPTPESRGGKDDATKQRRRMSLALCLYVNDISNKALMSGIEFEKLFAGNPAFYKWKYDKDGNLVDRTVDELKRAGGEGSTGVNNYVELKDVPAKYIGADGTFSGKYVCTEVQNELIQSPQYDMLVETMRTSMIRQTVLNKRIDAAIQKYEQHVRSIKKSERPSPEEQYQHEHQIRTDEIEKVDVLSLEDAIKELTADELAVAEARAKQASDSYESGIDVADGAAYITDTMCEMLLREIGAYSKSVQNAFKILRDKSSDDILKKATAYQKVITTVIGTQKYTAFGRRVDPNTGLLTVYYNKYALFPLFECMVTGKMSNIYHAMLDQNVDMLMIQSAVKVGSQGAKKIDFDKYAKSDWDFGLYQNDMDGTGPAFGTASGFNTYQQDFKYLRKQLNTDPTDEKYMNMGTQMTKIAFSSLVEGRQYRMRDGSYKSGEDILKAVMDSMNKLSDIGMSELENSFFKITRDDNGNITAKTNDPKKFVNELKQLMRDDDPNRNIIESLETKLVKDPDGTSHYEITVAPDAVQSSAWLESKLISRINKKVIDTETPGAAFIQRSIWGMEGSAVYEANRGSVIGDNNIPQTINGGKPLQMVNEEGSMDCILSMDFFIKLFRDPKTGKSFNVYDAKDKNGHIIYDYVLDDNGQKIPVYEKDETTHKYKLDKDGNRIQKKSKDGQLIYKKKKRQLTMSFDDARRWLINNNIIGTNAKANIIAYRIPTQAQASIHALRCVDVLPVVNDTVMLPAEFTKITGSDFKQILKSLNFFNCWETLTK